MAAGLFLERVANACTIRQALQYGERAIFTYTQPQSGLREGAYLCWCDQEGNTPPGAKVLSECEAESAAEKAEARQEAERRAES